MLFLTVAPYHFIALRRVFGGTRAATFGRGMLIGIVYWVLLMATMLGITLLVVLY